MATEAASGIQTAVIGTEHSLNIQTGAGVYQLLVDLANLANGDELELRIKAKARSAATNRQLVWMGTYQHVQSFPLVVSIPIATSSWEATLKQTAGTARSFEWGVYSI